MASNLVAFKTNTDYNFYDNLIQYLSNFTGGITTNKYLINGQDIGKYIAYGVLTSNDGIPVRTLGGTITTVPKVYNIFNTNYLIDGSDMGFIFTNNVPSFPDLGGASSNYKYYFSSTYQPDICGFTSTHNFTTSNNSVTYEKWFCAIFNDTTKSANTITFPYLNTRVYIVGIGGGGAGCINNYNYASGGGGGGGGSFVAELSKSANSTIIIKTIGKGGVHAINHDNTSNGVHAAYPTVVTINGKFMIANGGNTIWTYGNVKVTYDMENDRLNDEKIYDNRIDPPSDGYSIGGYGGTFFIDSSLDVKGYTYNGYNIQAAGYTGGNGGNSNNQNNHPGASGGGAAGWKNGSNGTYNGSGASAGGAGGCLNGSDYNTGTSNFEYNIYSGTAYGETIAYNIAGNGGNGDYGNGQPGKNYGGGSSGAQDGLSGDNGAGGCVMIYFKVRTDILYLNSI